MWWCTHGFGSLCQKIDIWSSFNQAFDWLGRIIQHGMHNSHQTQIWNSDIYLYSRRIFQLFSWINSNIFIIYEHLFSLLVWNFIWSDPIYMWKEFFVDKLLMSSSPYILKMKALNIIWEQKICQKMVHVSPELSSFNSNSVSIYIEINSNYGLLIWPFFYTHCLAYSAWKT